MPDPRFFKKARRFDVDELAEKFSCEIVNGLDQTLVLDDVAPLQVAQKNDLTFFDNIKYKADFTKTQAGACFVSEKVLDYAPEGLVCLVSDQPYKAYALAAQAFYPEALPKPDISIRAFIHKSAKIGKGCAIEDGAYIGEDVEIGDQVWIEANAVVRENVKIGARCRVGSNTSLSHCLIGEDVRIYPGVRVGQDGFGFAIDPAGHVKVPQLGRVIIEDHVEIGANTTIDRGAGPDTIIGQGTWIDNLVQIGHNVQIGRGCVIVAQVGVSGSTVIDDYVAIGGQSGIAGHLHVGKGARIGAQSGVMRDIPPGEEQLGSPALPAKQFLRQVVALNRLIKNKKSD